MEQLLAQGVFEPKATPEQTAALERLETLLALVEGWVQTVVTAALGDRIPGTAALSEMLRRRRATGGPAEQTFGTLVGLELRPRKLREAAVLWERLTEAAGHRRPRRRLAASGSAARRPRDLDDPAGFIDRVIGGDTSGIDEAIARATGRKPRGRQHRLHRDNLGVDGHGCRLVRCIETQHWWPSERTGSDRHRPIAPTFGRAGDELADSCQPVRTKSTTHRPTRRGLSTRSSRDESHRT